jgi:hypothetical protein
LHRVVPPIFARSPPPTSACSRRRREVRIEAASTTWLSIPSDCSTRWIQKPSRPASWMAIIGKSRPVRVLKDPELRQRLGAQAQESVRGRFLMIRLMEDWLDLIGSFEASFRLKGTPGA